MVAKHCPRPRRAPPACDTGRPRGRHGQPHTLFDDVPGGSGSRCHSSNPCAGHLGLFRDTFVWSRRRKTRPPMTRTTELAAWVLAVNTGVRWETGRPRPSARSSRESHLVDRARGSARVLDVDCTSSLARRGVRPLGLDHGSRAGTRESRSDRGDESANSGSRSSSRHGEEPTPRAGER